MKNFYLLLISILFLFTACKKDAVDATNIKTFQSSVNDMASKLNTLQQYKFNEALYILKTFGVEAEGDINELNALAKLLNGKKTQEIFDMADKVAQEKGISWSSTAPPSLGEMNIFSEDIPEEKDPTDVAASGLSLFVKTARVDSVIGPRGFLVVPRLVDQANNPIVFQTAALETTMEVFSNGSRISIAKNLMQDNNFKGFTLLLSSLAVEKVVDNKIDITVSVKTKNKTHKMSKIGISVNSAALRQPTVAVPADSTAIANSTTAAETNVATEIAKPKTDPKQAVQKFLNNIANQKLKAAYESSKNPNWGSYDQFASPTAGFGSVKNISVKDITTLNTDANSASVKASYEVSDKNGNKNTVQASFSLKNVDGEWKITNYKIK